MLLRCSLKDFTEKIVHMLVHLAPIEAEILLEHHLVLFDFVMHSLRQVGAFSP